ncbi:MAG TPA: phosphatase PAP2 family protein, partial [Lysobacter sp.]
MAPAPTPPDGSAEAAGHALRHEARFGVEMLRRHGWRLALVFVGLLLPLWGFAELADEVRDHEPLAFDEPLLRFANAHASLGLDRFFVFISAIGYAYGVVPADVVLVVALALRRRFREATFAAFALGGSGLLNMAAKRLFARERPALWDSIAPEATYSFPSGHAMGSATLAAVIVLFAWRTRWRMHALLAMGAFTVLVGASRVYLGVHYPSDIVAGWAAAVAWAAASFLVVFR